MTHYINRLKGKKPGSSRCRKKYFSSFPHDKVSQVKIIKITKETCCIKTDSLITTQSVNQLTHYQNFHDNLCRSRIKHGESHRTIQIANSKNLEEGRWRSFFFNTYYKVIKVMRYWYKKTNKSTEQNTVLRNNSLCIYICKVYSQGCQIHKRERTGSIAQIPRFHQLLCILTPDFHVQFPYPG